MGEGTKCLHEIECWQATGRPPITLKWVDGNKDDDVHENYRSRLVAREVKSQGQAAYSLSMLCAALCHLWRQSSCCVD